MLYDKRSATFYRNEVSLSTVNGRVECEFELPTDSPTPYEQYVLSDEYEFRANTLQYDRATDEFYFHITTRKYDDDEFEVSADTGHPDETVLGIDLGVRKSEALAQPIRNLRFLRMLTVSPSPRPARSGKGTNTITGATSSRSGVVRCNNAARRPHTTRFFASGSVKKPGANSTSTRSPTNSSRKPSNTTAT